MLHTEDHALLHKSKEGHEGGMESSKEAGLIRSGRGERGYGSAFNHSALHTSLISKRRARPSEETAQDVHGDGLK